MCSSDLFPSHDIVVLLLFVGLKVAEKGSFEDEYFEKLEKLKELNMGKLEHTTEIASDKEEKAGAEIRVGAKQSYFGAFFNASLFAGYKINKNDREKVRKILYIDKTKLMALINEIIQKYEENTSKSEKQLFLILDDLEKIKKAEDIEKIFFYKRSPSGIVRVSKNRYYTDICYQRLLHQFKT